MSADWDQLFDLLVAQFAETEQPWAVVEETVRNTPFRILKTLFKTEAKSDKPCFKIVSPEKVRANTIDDELTRIAFA